MSPLFWKCSAAAGDARKKGAIPVVGSLRYFYAVVYGSFPSLSAFLRSYMDSVTSSMNAFSCVVAMLY